MFHLIFSLLITGWFALARQGMDVPRIDNPLPGQALQGVIPLNGSSAVDGFASAQIEFRYENDPVQTWFLIQENIPAIENDVLASWDTTTITDGNYCIRLKVTKVDGSETIVEVAGLRVRNYSMIETITPDLPLEETHGITMTVTATARVPQNTPTPQPPNPVSVTDGDLQESVLRGLAVIAVLFILSGIYWGIRRLGRR
jgi:hypothetical protein